MLLSAAQRLRSTIVCAQCQLQLEAVVRAGRKRPVSSSWRTDEAYIKVKGLWQYLYRAVDKFGDTIDFMLNVKRDEAAARKFFNKVIVQHGRPEKVVIDKSGSNATALETFNWQILLSQMAGCLIEPKKISCPLHLRNLVSRSSVDQIEFLVFSTLCG